MPTGAIVSPSQNSVQSQRQTTVCHKKTKAQAMPSIDEIVLTWVLTRAQPSRFVDRAGQPMVSILTDGQRGYLPFLSGNNPAGGSDWQLPWSGDHSGDSHYWSRSAGAGYRSGAFSVTRLWGNQVPLRWRIPPAVQARPPQSGLQAAASASVLLYPTGMAAIVTVVLSGPLDLPGVQALARALDEQPLVSVAGGPTKLGRDAPETLLAAAESAVLGAASLDADLPDRRPTLATISAVTEWPIMPIGQADDTHRALAGLARVRGLPPGFDPGPLSNQLIAPYSVFPDTSRLSIGDGAVIFSPYRAATPVGRRRLRCYHDNCVLALAQTSLLLDTVDWLSRGTGTWEADDQLRDTVKRVVATLGPLNGPGGDLFRTRLTRLMIQSSGLIPAVNATRHLVDISTDLESDPATVVH